MKTKTPAGVHDHVHRWHSRSILLIDDERLVLKGITRLLLVISHDGSIGPAASGVG